MSYIGNQPTNVAFVTDQFSGNGSTVAFTMSVAPATTGSVLVAVTGVLQDPSTYSVSGTTLTFSAAPPSGTGNISVRYLGIPASGVTTTAYRTVTDFTATAGQTTFTVPSYTVGYIDVYRNGSKLGTADFTATNGTTVVLASGASAGDLVETVSFYVSSVLNAIPNTAGSVSQSNLAAGTAGNGPAFCAYATSQQTGISAATFTQVALGSEEFDTGSLFNNTAGTVGGIPAYAFKPNVAGYYYMNGVFWGTAGGNTMNSLFVTFYKNGAWYKDGAGENISGVGAVSELWSMTSCLVYLNGTTDYIQLYVWGNTTSGTYSSYGNYFLNRIRLEGVLVRAA